MHWVHDDYPERRVRLAYCLNLHAGETFQDTLAGIRHVTLPLRDRVAPGATFGVGLYLPNAVVSSLVTKDRANDLVRLVNLLTDQGLDPFTFNAFPYGGFHAASLKEAVFRQTWSDPERLAFTLRVASIASWLARRTGHLTSGAHISISTHAGRFGAWSDGDERDAATLNIVRFAFEAAGIEERDGVRIVLALEPEPRSSANDLTQLAAYYAHVREEGPRLAASAGLGTPERVRELLARHLGTCLDACHAAVEFEDGASALTEPANGTRSIGPLGKLQFSSALALRDPAVNTAGRERLFAMAEPRYLHQVTGRLADGTGLVRATDLPELAEAYPDPASPWARCDEWRCHFHVPVDLAQVGDTGLATTSAAAGELLQDTLAAPSTWGTRELHLEIETYTWDILPGDVVPGASGLVDGLEREYRHVIALLENGGWRRC